MYSNKTHLLLSDLERERMVKHMVVKKVEQLTQAMMPITRATASPRS